MKRSCSLHTPVEKRGRERERDKWCVKDSMRKYSIYRFGVIAWGSVNDEKMNIRRRNRACEGAEVKKHSCFD